MFGKKVVCVSLCTLLAAAPLHGIFWSNWWGRSNQQKVEDQKKIRNEKVEDQKKIRNGFENVLKDLKTGRHPYSIESDLFRINAELYTYRFLYNHRDVSSCDGLENPTLPYFGTLSQKKFRDLRGVQEKNCHHSNEKKIKQKEEDLFSTCIKHNHNKEDCKRLAEEYVTLLTGKNFRISRIVYCNSGDFR